VTSALPIIEPPFPTGLFTVTGTVAGTEVEGAGGVLEATESLPDSGCTDGAGTSTVEGGGAGRNFFLKKLNIG
jgi:hypothetical protein